VRAPAFVAPLRNAAPARLGERILPKEVMYVVEDFNAELDSGPGFRPARLNAPIP
jgi:hypothetical protein